MSNDAPRLYLDTADLVEIGDGRVRNATLERLIEGCVITGTVLMLSPWHRVDLRAAPDDAATRVIHAADRFPNKALLLPTDEGVEIEAIESLDSFVRENATSFSLLDEAVDIATRTEIEVEKELAVDPSPSPLRIKNLMMRLLAEMYESEDEVEALRIGEAFLWKRRRDIPPEQAPAIVEGMLGLWRARVAAREEGIWDEEQFRVQTRDQGAPPAHVGKRLSALVDDRRRAQKDRDAQNGDLPDRNHAILAPYVDIFTGDKDICSWIDEWRRRLAYERPVHAITSNHLDLVATAVEEFVRGPQ